MADRLIQVRLVGENLIPSNVRSSELAQLIKSVEGSIATLIATENAQYDVSEILVGLVNIHEGTVGLDFAPNLQPLAHPAWHRISEGVRTNNYSDIPRTSIKHIQEIARFSRHRRCNIELRELNGTSQLLATITPSTTIEPVPLIRGHTTLYGELRQIGGKEPSAKIALSDGRAVNCSISQSLAKKLAPRLYTWVGLIGVAHWNSETYALERFKVIEISDYEDVPITDVMRDLRRLVGRHFDKIEDVDRFVSDVRSGEGDLDINDK